MRSRLLTTLTLLLIAAAPAAGQTAADPVAAMKNGKEHFERACRLCHDLERALFPARDPAELEKIVKRMAAYGAPLNAEQRPLVTRYLATRSLFSRSCGVCHEPSRVVGDAPGPRDWKAVGERMAGHLRELQAQGKAPEGAAFTPENLADIAALLQASIH